MGRSVTPAKSVEVVEVAGAGCAHLSVADREEISRGVAAGRSGREIARGMGRHYSVVNREIAGHGGRGAFGRSTRTWLLVAAEAVRRAESSRRSRDWWRR